MNYAEATKTRKIVHDTMTKLGYHKTSIENDWVDFYTKDSSGGRKSLWLGINYDDKVIYNIDVEIYEDGEVSFGERRLITDARVLKFFDLLDFEILKDPEGKIRQRIDDWWDE